MSSMLSQVRPGICANFCCSGTYVPSSIPWPSFRRSCFGYIHICICICIIYYICMGIYIYMYVSIGVSLSLYVYIYICICVYIYIGLSLSLCMCIYIYIYTYVMYVCVYIYIYRQNIYSPQVGTSGGSSSTWKMKVDIELFGYSQDWV